MKQQKPLIFIFSSLLALLLMSACGSKGPYNPYLDLKVKPSQEIARENKEMMKKSSRKYKRQMRSNRKTIFGKKKAPKR